MSIAPDFEELYTADPDPWEVATSWYERRKTHVLLACLRRQRYGTAWDVGCGTGELAALLAARCDRVVATDAAERACELTRRRSAAEGDVLVERSTLPLLPDALRDRPADLVVLSEVLYYLSEADRRAAAETLAAACAPEGDIVAVHWSATTEGASVSGIGAHRDLDRALIERGWWRLVAHRDVEFTLTLWSRDMPATIGRSR